MKSTILYQDDDLLVFNKPAGLLSQKDKSGDEDIVAFLKKMLPGKAFVAPVHRLDRNTSGLLLVALNAESAAKLSKALQDGRVKRKYLAIVKGDPGENGRIDLPLRKEESTNESFVVEDGGKEAVTLFQCKKKMGATSLVEVELETGRSHQIRVHFSHIKCALIGDKKYAKKPWSEIFSRPALHAGEIHFSHPRTNKPMHFQVDAPEDFQQLLKSLL